MRESDRPDDQSSPSSKPALALVGKRAGGTRGKKAELALDMGQGSREQGFKNSGCR